MREQTSIEAAVARLSDDGLIAYPTETVWGLGACADRPRAVDRLFSWKGRRGDQPMAVLVGSGEAARALGCRIDEGAERLILAFWPGPLTIVAPCDAEFAPGVAGADGALGLRCSDHPVAVALVQALEKSGLGPLTSTSLNRSGEAPATSEEAAEAMLREGGETGIDRPLLFSQADGMAAARGGPEIDSAGAAMATGRDDAKPSSVVDCTGRTPRILRVGAIDADELERVWAQ